MKRLFGILVIFLFLLQILAGMYISYYGVDSGSSRIEGVSAFNDEEHSGKSKNEDGLVKQCRFGDGSGSEAGDDSRNGIMSNHTEQDEFGGSWFDDFDDDSGIEDGLGSIRLEADEHTVGLWHFDEGIGNEAKDASGNGNHGMLTNMEGGDWVDGRFGKGLEFDGSGEHVDMGDPADDSLEASGSFTVECLIKTGTTDSDMIISKKGDGPRGFYLATTNSGKLKLHFHGSGGVVSYDSISEINDNIWHYVTIVVGDDGIKTYIDGYFDSSSDSIPGDCSNTIDFKIGVSEHSSSFWYTGVIDEVRISDTARTPREIRRNYEGALALRNGKVELDCWKYERAITITNDGDPLTDYQIQVNLTPQNFDYSHAKADSGDVRFYDGNGNKLGYWIEEWNCSGDSNIWVNVTKIPNGVSEIWMNYGNPNAGSESDGDAVFEFFDDFNGNDVAQYWAKNAVGPSPEYSVRDSWLTITNSDSNSDWLSDLDIHKSNQMQTDSNIGAENFYLKYCMRWESTSSEVTQGGVGIVKSDDHIIAWGGFNDGGKNQGDIGVPHANIHNPIGGSNDWKWWGDNKNLKNATYEIFRSQNIMTIKKDGFQLIKNTNSESIASIGIFHCNFQTYEFGTIEFDYIFTCRYSSLEPTTLIEDERHNPTYATLTSTTITPPQYQPWTMLSLSKTEPENTYINVSIIDAETNTTVPGYDNRTEENIFLYMLTDLGVRSIRLKAYFSGNGSTTPTLDSWGVEWSPGDSWRDSFVGDGKIDRDNSSVVGTKIDEHTVALWRFDERGGDKAWDATGNLNHGTLYNMGETAWVDGRFGKALEFDGVDDYVMVPYNETLDISNEITLEAWINTKSIETRYIMRKSGMAYSYELRMELSGQLSMIFEGVSIFSIDTILVGEWFHVAGTYNGTHVALYINGELDNRMEYTGGIVPGDDELYLGAPSSTPGMGFNGTIDEISISNVSRTPQEIREVYQAGISIRGGQVQLVDNEVVPGGDTSALWRFNEGKENMLHDSSGNGNDGVIHGANWTEGVMDSALEFDGLDDYVNIPDGEHWYYDSGDFTFNCWIKFNELPSVGDENYLYHQLGSGEFVLFYLKNAGGQLQWTFYTSAGPTQLFFNTVLEIGNWYHVIITKDGIEYRVFQNGHQKDITRTGPAALPDITAPLYIGRHNSGYFFNGIMDEVAIYNRALSPSEITAHANRYQHNATLRSSTITIPTNKTWGSVHCSRSVPDNTYLNISFHDADTDEILLTNTNRTEELYIDISHINSIIHPTIYLEAAFQSNRTETPILYDWAVNWTTGTNEFIPPELLEDLPGVLEIIEDTPKNNVIDLADYFSDIYSSIQQPEYALQSDPSGVNISLSLNESQLDVNHLADNWTGNIPILANCTNIHGLSTSANMFNITVIPVDDAPAWNSTPPAITVKQGTSNTSEYSLDEYVVDAENDLWEFSVSSDDSNIIVIVDGEGHMVITHSGDFFGSTSVIATVLQSDNHSLLSNISISVNVLENIALDARLLSPRNETTITETNVTLEWRITGRDGGSHPITFDLYWGENRTPSLYMSDLEKENHTISALKDNTTYYWYVIPSDENGRGVCSDATWSFIVNKSALAPGVNYTTSQDGDTINSSSVQLTWITQNPLNETLSFYVYVGISSDSIAMNATTENETFLLEGLMDNTTYYWKIVPWSDRITGRSNSGIWHFIVKKDFVPIYNISWSIGGSPLKVKKGDTLSFNLTINNTGNKVNTVVIEKVGLLAERAALSKTNFNLLPGDPDMTSVLLFTSDFNVGEHILTLKLVHGGGEDIIEIPVNITGETLPEPKPPDEKDSGLLLAAIVAIVLLFITGIVVLVLIKKRRRKEDDADDGYAESDAIEADIVQVPVMPGQTPAVPSQPVGMAPAAPPAFQDARYQMKGREVLPVPPPTPIPSMPASNEPFDISKISIPSEPDPPPSPVDITQQYLALPPARFLEVKEEERRVPIEELFLMTPDGLLVQHYSLQRESGINEDVLASMLSAVKSFILDSLSMLEKETGEESEVNRIDVGKYSVMMASGKSLALVAISAHEKKDIILGQIKKGVDVIEDKFGEVMIDWDGDMSKVEGVKPYIESLVKGEFDPDLLKLQTEPAAAASSGEKPELPTGLKAITIALPDPIKVPDTARALPEKTESIPEEVTEGEGTGDILASLDDILIGREEPSVPEASPPAAAPLPEKPDRPTHPPLSEATSQDPSSIASSKTTTDKNIPLPPEA